MIEFRRTTTVQEITEHLTPYPLHYFNFALFEQLKNRIADVKVLSDVIGIVVSMTSTRKVQLNNRPDEVDRRDLEIQDKDGQIAKVTLYGYMAQEINREQIENKIVNPVLICAGMLIRTYYGEMYAASSSGTKIFLDLEIPETIQLKERYKDEPVVFRYTEMEHQQVIPVNNSITTASVADLHNLNPSANKTTRFNLTATIVDIKIPFGWYYGACRECHNSLTLYNQKLCCRQHGEKTTEQIYKFNVVVEDSTGQINFVVFGKQADKLIGFTLLELLASPDTDKYVVPPALKRLIGQTKTFQVSLTARSIDTNKVALKLYDCDYSRGQKRKAESIMDVSPKTPHAGTSQEVQSSPLAKQTSRELFPEETPAKEQKTRGKEPET